MKVKTETFSKKRIQLIFQFLVGLVLLVFWWRFFDLDFFLTSLKGMNLKVVLGAGLVYLLASFLRGVRFKLVLDNLLKVPVFQVFAINNLGAFTNFLIPLRAGELVKPVIIKRQYPRVSGSQVLSAVLIDKISDLFSMFFLVLILTPFVLGLMGSLKLMIIGGIFLGLVVGFLLALIWQKSFFLKLISFLADWPFLRFLPKRVWEYLKNFLAGFSFFKNKELLLVGIFLFSLLETGLDGLSFYLLFRSLGFEVFLSSAILGLTLLYFSFLIPSAPGYLGTLEVMGMLVLVLGLGVGENEASTVVAFYHLFSGLILFLSALWATNYLKIGNLTTQLINEVLKK